MCAGEAGFLTAVETEEIGRTAMMLGAGRLRKEDGIDPAAGLVLSKKIGDRIEKGEPIAELMSAREAVLPEAAVRLKKALTVGEAPVSAPPLIYNTEECV